ncbi:winged helix-turn-helix domain-containing protein [Chondrinema litorale]|uniref:winged helix-turn-helix domain-containing protein n=1 Tax=Chondrinema litorale TaxID=2994555 RepID=UPI002543C687|nr:winged helix-turn-helix domain-containing protein [Chondrinema litorale]UZR94895.1 winged helix-turn-helix domain-containing protein [Chondrinema litorale]
MLSIACNILVHGTLLHQWGFSYCKPPKKEPRKNPELVKKWKKERLPNLLKTAKKEGRKVYYGDEASFFVTPKLQKCFLPQANPFPVEIWSKSFEHIFVCAAISSEGDFTYTTSKHPYKGDDIVSYLEQLLAAEPDPITLI